MQLGPVLSRALSANQPRRLLFVNNDKRIAIEGAGRWFARGRRLWATSVGRCDEVVVTCSSAANGADIPKSRQGRVIRRMFMFL
ncbi:MAG: hypothetical protein CM1200mP9_03670 [Gammaproteobacteria bacterium]|nr:MAG: hypothetical protein CM1200mP9_03670 [Gammaproteobacteria bacterium]